MYETTKNRIIEWANFIVDNNSTIRGCAKHYGMAKSTIHFYLKNKLPRINASLYHKLREVLINNFEVKHIRGGQATKQKYLEEKLTS